MGGAVEGKHISWLTSAESLAAGKQSQGESLTEN